MQIKDMKTINVLNYNANIVVVSTKHDSYAIEAAPDNEHPTILPLSLEEILYINGNSMAFKSGILRFPEEIEQEMYEDYLRIPTWKDLLTIKDIEDIILKPTAEGLQQLVNVKDSCVFDRIRGVFIRLKNTTSNDISMRVEKVIDARAAEFRKGIRNTEIEIKAKDIPDSASTAEVQALKSQNEALQEQLNAMQKMMEQLLTSNNSTKEQQSNVAEVSESVPAKRKPGRPKTAK